jgi:uncharacterized membrane protein
MIFFGLNRRVKENQPKLTIERTPVDWIFELLAILGLFALLGVSVYYYPKLPDTIPSHFNGSGLPDKYEGKSFFWVLPGISVFLYILLSVINLFPHRFNYPFKITQQNAFRQYTLGTRLIRYIKMILVWLFFHITLSVVRSANHSEQGLGSWSMPVFLAFIFIPIIVYFILSYKKS